MAHGGELTPSATAYPLNSRRLTAHGLHEDHEEARAIYHSPAGRPKANRRRPSGRGRPRGHERGSTRRSVGTRTLRDEEGVFLEVHPEEEEQLSDGRGSPREREGCGADVDSRGEDEGAAVIEAHEVSGARPDPASPTARARAREEELIAELETDLIEMEIDTGGASPKRQPARRMPFSVRQEIAKQLDQMQKSSRQSHHGQVP